MINLHFIKITEEHLELILKWRTSEFVTRNMYTDIEFDMEKQKNWFEGILNDSNSLYWLMSYKDQLIGLVSITDWNQRDRRAYWNYYIGAPAFSMLGGFIGPYLYNYAFQNLNLHKLMGEVMEGNEGVRKLHLRHGAREVGYFTDHIYKNGKYHDVYLYEMTEDMWKDRKDKFVKYIPIVEE